MKKSKLSFGLVTSFIAAMSLSACGSNVTSKKDALVTFKPYGEGETIDIVTDEMYQKYHKTTDGISKFYSQILEVLIRYEFEKNDGQNGMLTLAEIKQKAEDAQVFDILTEAVVDEEEELPNMEDELD